MRAEQLPQATCKGKREQEMRAVTSLEPQGKSKEEPGFITVISLAQATKGSFACSLLEAGPQASGRGDGTSQLLWAVKHQESRHCYTDSETVGCVSPAGGQVSEKSQETTILLKRRMESKTAVRHSPLVQPPCLQTDHCGVQTHRLDAGRRKEKPQSASNLFSGRDLLNLIALPLHLNGPNWSDGDTQGCSS